jgi:hypothetical protein
MLLAKAGKTAYLVKKADPLRVCSVSFSAASTVCFFRGIQLHPPVALISSGKNDHKILNLTGNPI